MSMTSSVTVRYGSESKVSPSFVIRLLLDGGWLLDDNGAITYLPLGDKGEFNWATGLLTNINEVFETIFQKEKNGELVGVVLTWNNTGQGGSLLFYEDQFIMNCTVDRKIVSKNWSVKCTDFTWYLERIIPCLEKGGLCFDYVKCEDIV